MNTLHLPRVHFDHFKFPSVLELFRWFVRGIVILLLLLMALLLFLMSPRALADEGLNAYQELNADGRPSRVLILESPDPVLIKPYVYTAPGVMQDSVRAALEYEQGLHQFAEAAAESSWLTTEISQWSGWIWESIIRWQQPARLSQYDMDQRAAQPFLTLVSLKF